MKRLFLFLSIILFASSSLFATDQWVEGANGKINGFTLHGGHENGKNLFLCAGYKGGTYHPGKLVGKSCHFGWGGKEITQSNYYTLQVSKESLKRYRWFKTSNGAMPNANGYVPIEVGQEGDRTLYVCRAAYNGGVHPGKVVDGNCNISWGGDEHTIPSYEMLMFNTN